MRLRKKEWNCCMRWKSETEEKNLHSKAKSVFMEDLSSLFFKDPSLSFWWATRSFLKITRSVKFSQIQPNTVNSLYCGHPRDRELVSLIARVCTTANSRLADTLLLRTPLIIRMAAKSPAKINYRHLTEINSCYYGLSLLRTLTCGPEGVRNKGSWL